MSISPESRAGVLLLQLGTPDDPSVPAVRRYLGEFLMDEMVIDVPLVPRWLLVHGIILRTRPKKSAAAYRKVWTERGSPLAFHTTDLAVGVHRELGDAVCGVEVGMRYGNPSIAGAIDRLVAAGADRLVVLPLFPQHSRAAWGSAAAKALDVARARHNLLPIRVVPPFWNDAGFLDACAARARGPLAELQPDRVVVSFHGLPERHVKASDPTGAHCRPSRDGCGACCDTIVDANRFCYRAHCVGTARGLAERLGLADDAWQLAFQSRLGREPWLQPYFDTTIEQLAQDGVKRVLVLSPAFVADCLETLEEIAIGAAEDFRAAGGEELVLAPSLNAEPDWIDVVARLVRSQLA